MHLKKKHYTLKKIPHLVQISILLILCLFFLCQLGIGSFFRIQHTENQMFKPYPTLIYLLWKQPPSPLSPSLTWKIPPSEYNSVDIDKMAVTDC